MGRRFQSGFANVRELLSYVLGVAVLLYGVVGASADKALLAIGAGLSLVGAPMIGGFFDRKDRP